MDLVSLRHLHAFAAVAASGGIRRSSDSLCRASSAVARSVVALEDSLDVQLFERKGRGMLLTGAGEVVRMRAERIEAELKEVGRRWIERFGRVLAELRHIPADIAALNGVLQGTVTIGALPLARSQLLPMAIAAVLEKHPLLRIRSLESPYEELMAGLLSGRVDFIVGSLRPATDNTFESRVLISDKAAVVARSNHPLAAKKRLTLSSLAGYPWVLSRAGTPLRESLVQFFERAGAAPPVPAVETGDLALVRGLLVASDMLTVLSAHQLHHEVLTGQLVVLPCDIPGLERPIGVSLRRGAHLSPGAKALLAEIDGISAKWR
jgi:LysR family transcriptional regulator of gallate degradation